MVKKVNYILLEDEPITALALRRTLSSLRPDWTLVGTSDLAADIPSLISLAPDWIMADLFLCDGPSTEAIAEKSCRIPLVLLSGYPRPGWRDDASANIVAFIEKPITRGMLEQALKIVEKTIE